MKGSVLLNNVFPLFDTKNDEATFQFWATGTHEVLVGVQAGVDSVGLSVGQALLFGVVTEIEVTALNPVASIEVRGPSSVDEQSSANYTCVARFREGPSLDVTHSASCNWQVDKSTVAVTSPGQLSVGSLSSSDTCTLTVTYTSWITSDTGHKFTASMPLTLVNRSGALSGMSLIPAGSFWMGDSLREGLTDESPVHSVYVSAFYVDKYEVTKALWDEVATWASSAGYDISPGDGDGKGWNHPVYNVSWYQAVKWANARSEKEGLTPCYYTDSTLRTVYRKGELDLSTDCVNWTSHGYRLPTEAEWEKAARGDCVGYRFPWCDVGTIEHNRANYYSIPSQFVYDKSPTITYHPTYATGARPHTSPVGSFAPNGYGLCDMAGNVAEWCWDWYGTSYYASSPTTDPRGPTSGSFHSRATRGGGWSFSSMDNRVAARSSRRPDSGEDFLGLRLVRY
jgi:formylglycine-generating enzyme required for sulfatase activity